MVDATEGVPLGVAVPLCEATWLGERVLPTLTTCVDVAEGEGTCEGVPLAAPLGEAVGVGEDDALDVACCDSVGDADGELEPLRQDVGEGDRVCVAVAADDGEALKVAEPLGDPTWVGVGVPPTLTT